MKTKPLCAIIVDDERLAALYLERIVSSFDDVEIVGVFANAREAIAGIEGRTIDVAFLDISMPQVNGLELLETLKTADPNMEVVLVTGYDQYALEAYRKHALGYLLKPCTKEDVEYYLDQVRHLRRKRRKHVLVVKTFGSFEVYANGEHVTFANAKAKELLALLVDARGANLSIETIANALWEGHAFDESVKALVRRAVSDLRRLGKSVGAEDLITGSRGFVGLNTSLVSCDLYDYLANNDAEFPGTYLEQYSWAEETAAALAFGTLR